MVDEMLTIMDDNDDEAQNTMSMDGFQLVDESQHHNPKNESALGTLVCGLPSEVSEESIVAELMTIMNDADANSIISMDESTHGLHLVKELERRTSVTDPSEDTAFPNVKIVLDVDEVEGVTSDGHGTNTVHLLGELNRQDDEIGHTVPPLEHRNNVIDLIGDERLEHDEVENSVPSVEVCERIMLEEMKHVSEKDEVENIVLTDDVNSGLHLGEDPNQQQNETVSADCAVANMMPVLSMDENENTEQAMKDARLVVNFCSQRDDTELSMNSTIVADTLLQVGTVSSKKELKDEEEKVAEELHKQMADCEARKHENTNLKVNLSKKRTEIEGELKSLKAQMGEKLKKIDEIAKKEGAIDTEIADMELQCNENKRKHAMFIDLFKLIVESQLPLRTHRGIELLMVREDQTARKYLTSALKLRIKIDARTKLKPALLEQRTELEKIVEALKVQMDQSFKDADELKKLEEALLEQSTKLEKSVESLMVQMDQKFKDADALKKLEHILDSEKTHIVPQHSRRMLVYTRSYRKRKTHDDRLSEEMDISPPEVQAKRANLKTVETDSPEECFNDGMATNP